MEDLISLMAIETYERKHGRVPDWALKGRWRFFMWWCLLGGRRKHENMVMYGEGFRDGWIMALKLAESLTDRHP